VRLYRIKAYYNIAQPFSSALGCYDIVDEIVHGKIIELTMYIYLPLTNIFICCNAFSSILSFALSVQSIIRIAMFLFYDPK
jgi:hypothetical protein